jgi:hypothetical protein
MQLGTRWPVGDEPPSRLPEVMVGAIADVESELDELDRVAGAGVDTTNWRWTLTWLEGRPVVELDDGTVLNYDPATETVVRSQLE